MGRARSRAHRSAAPRLQRGARWFAESSCSSWTNWSPLLRDRASGLPKETTASFVLRIFREHFQVRRFELNLRDGAQLDLVGLLVPTSDGIDVLHTNHRVVDVQNPPDLEEVVLL